MKGGLKIIYNNFFIKTIFKRFVFVSLLILSVGGILAYTTFPATGPNSLNINTLPINIFNSLISNSCGSNSGPITSISSIGGITCGKNPNLASVNNNTAGGITFPANGPDGSNKNGVLIGAFRNFLESSCPSGQYIVGTASDGSKVCEGSSNIANLSTTTSLITFPNSLPDGTNSNGAIGTKMLKFFNSPCTPGQYLAGINSDGNKKCSPKPVDCIGSWSNTSSCSVACGGGVLQQVYSITTPAAFGGTSCPISNGTTQWGSDSCNTHNCPISGSCSTTAGSCISGTSSNTNPGTCGTVSWSCSGLYGGSTASCSKTLTPCPINGSCSTTAGSCISGTVTGDNNATCGTRTWSCSGLYGGSTANCSKTLTPCYTYSWVAGVRGSCSVTCGGGNQTRVVSCLRNDGNIVADSYCTGIKPIENQSCNIQACPINYDIVYNIKGKVYKITNSLNQLTGSATSPPRIVYNTQEYTYDNFIGIMDINMNDYLMNWWGTNFIVKNPNLVKQCSSFCNVASCNCSIKYSVIYESYGINLYSFKCGGTFDCNSYVFVPVSGYDPYNPIATCPNGGNINLTSGMCEF